MSTNSAGPLVGAAVTDKLEIYVNQPHTPCHYYHSEYVHLQGRW